MEITDNQKAGLILWFIFVAWVFFFFFVIFGFVSSRNFISYKFMHADYFALIIQAYSLQETMHCTWKLEISKTMISLSYLRIRYKNTSRSEFIWLRKLFQSHPRYSASSHYLEVGSPVLSFHKDTGFTFTSKSVTCMTDVTAFNL